MTQRQHYKSCIEKRSRKLGGQLKGHEINSTKWLLILKTVCQISCARFIFHSSANWFHEWGSKCITVTRFYWCYSQHWLCLKHYLRETFYLLRVVFCLHHLTYQRGNILQTNNWQLLFTLLETAHDYCMGNHAFLVCNKFVVWQLFLRCWCRWSFTAKAWVKELEGAYISYRNNTITFHFPGKVRRQYCEIVATYSMPFTVVG